MNATASLPGVSSVPSAAESIAKIRAMFAPYLEQPRRRVEQGEAMWRALSEGERRFICRAAKLDAATLPARTWYELADDQRDALQRAWQRFREWVARVQLVIEQEQRR